MTLRDPVAAASPAEASRTSASDRFRLREFVRLLGERGELETVDDPLDLADVAARLDGNPRAVLFRNLRGCGMELAGNVMGSRRPRSMRRRYPTLRRAPSRLHVTSIPADR